MKIYNTLTGKKQEFVPLEGNKVKMYACGITVSGEAHIGHAYQALIYDIIRKYLEKIGYDVTYARNYTDVDDKIIAKSNETGIPADIYAVHSVFKISMREFAVRRETFYREIHVTLIGWISVPLFYKRGNESDNIFYALRCFKPKRRVINLQP